MSSINVRYGSASIELDASVDLYQASGKRTVGYTPRDLLVATEQVLRAIGTAESHDLANAVAELAAERAIR